MRDMEESMAVKAPGLITLLQPIVRKSQLAGLVEDDIVELVDFGAEQVSSVGIPVASGVGKT
jgi:hypothetical protein